MRWIALIVALIALPALAGETCAPGPDRGAARAGLFEALRAAPDPVAAGTITDQIWREWLTAPDARAATLLSAALNEIGEGLDDAALDTLGALIAYCPGYAEAWNQRATLLYRLGRFEESLSDVEAVLAREPRHFGALAGRAVMLMAQGRMDPGQRALREALAIHPWLSERRLLIETPGQDL